MIVSERLARMKQRFYDEEMWRKKVWWGEGSTVLTEGASAEPLIVRKAKAIRYVCENMPIEIRADELIVGVPVMSSAGLGTVFPDYATPEEKANAKSFCLNELSVWGHHPPDYARILKNGLKGIKAEIQDQVAALGPDPEKERKAALYEAMLVSLNAVKSLQDRYSKLSLEMSAVETDPTRKEELMRIHEACSRVPEDGASSFREALQSSWFIYLVLNSCLDLVPLGRSDQYLFPYLKSDMDAGRITKAEASDLLGCWLWKFSARVQVSKESWENHYTFGHYSQGGNPKERSSHIDLEPLDDSINGLDANHFLCNMILGGQNEKGEDATNEVTYMLLDLWTHFELVVPVLSVRLHAKSPKRLVSKCAQAIIQNGSGEPAIYNDDTIVRGLVESGIPIEDARNYSNDGCSEALIPGKSECSLFDIEVLQLLEYVLNRGKSILRNEQEGLDTGDPTEFESFDALYSALLAQVKESVRKSIENKVAHYGKTNEIAPVPLLSSMIADCIRKGEDITRGGAHYIFYWPSVAGASHCVDSLAAIKKVVFEERKASLKEVVDALKANFADREPLRKMLLNHAPKYGNDAPYVDGLLTRLAKDIQEILADFQKTCPWIRLNPNFSTGERYAVFGKRVGASADGRKAEEPIGSNLSPSIGMDRNGPTASLLSAASINHVKFMTGSPVDLTLNTSEVSGKIGSDLVEGLLRTFLELGPTIMTLRIASPAVYEEARLFPEKHRSLRVRVGGFSTYFITLSPKQQEVMINRLIHK